jgi:hypothetical protein
MRCPSCGRDVSDQPFCEGCGKPLKAEKSAPIELKPVTQSADKPLSPVPSSAESGAAPHATPSARTKEKPETATSQPRWQGIVWTALAIVLYLAIADAAVETFLRDSPLRWWIAGAAALYLALCVAVWRLMPKLWRRLNWANQAAISLLVLLALMSATAWMPGGLEQGLNLVGQPTSIVLAIVSAVVVALSGIFLARLQFVPLAGKIVAGLLALYAVAAFLLAANAGTPYPSLFHGASQWTRLPFWMQGATVGGLFLVPLALLLEIVTGLRQFTRDKISDFAFRVIALAMSLVITAAAIQMSTDTGYDAGTIETPPWFSENHEKPLEGESGYKRASRRLSRIIAGVDVLQSKIDRSQFEIDALAARLGSDPTAMFHFVRDEIRYEPYTGVLRGALGTLLCRAGNSLDRSLLLAALLQKAGLQTQIARGQLSLQQSQMLVSRLFEPVRPMPQGVVSSAELAPELGRAIGVDPAKLLEAADEAQKYGDKQQKYLANYVATETGLLSDLLNRAGVDAGVITPNDQLLAEASEHYWVEYQNSNSQWVDLDSAFSEAEPGKIVVSATNTFAPDAVPEELYHHLHITMTLRVAQVSDGKDGSTTDTALLDQELRVPDQQGVDIILANQATPLSDLTKPGTSLPKALAAVKGFQAILQVGDRSTTGKFFDLKGQVSDQLGGPVGDVVTNAGGVGGSMGGLGGGIGNVLGGATSQGPASRIVGEWVDYTLKSPSPNGQSAIVHNYHRDIIPPVIVTSWSASGPPETSPANVPEDALRQRLMWYSELYPVSGSIIPGYAGYLQMQSLKAGASHLDSLLKSVYGLLPDQPVTMPPRRPIANTLLASEAAYLTNEFTKGRFTEVRSYFGTPGLISYETGGMGPSGTSGFPQGYDIVAYAPRVVASRGSGAPSARQQAASLHLTYGTLATRLERELMAGSGAAQEEDTRVLNATKVFAAAQQLAVPISVLRPGAGSAHEVENISVAEPVKSELAEGLQAQQVLIVPSRSIKIDGQLQTAWWRLDSSSGELLGVGPGGRGQNLTEYIEAAENVNGVICALGAGKDLYDGHITNGLLTGLMCLMSKVAGGNGTPEDRTMTWVGIMIHVIVVIADIANQGNE